MIKKYPLLSYFVLTFILAWIFWTIPIFLSIGLYQNEAIKSFFGFGVCVPIITAVLFTALLYGKEGVKRLISRCSLRRIHIKWFLASAFIMILISLLTVLLHGIVFGNPGNANQWYSFIDFFSILPIMIFFSLLEEVGWRGFALPELRKRFNPFSSALILGFIWGIWHLPKLISEGMDNVGSFIAFIVFVLLISILISWIYENTGGNILLSILTHASVNAAIYGINSDILPNVSYNSGTVVLDIVLMLFIIIILIVIGPQLKKPMKT